MRPTDVAVVSAASSAAASSRSVPVEKGQPATSNKPSRKLPAPPQSSGVLRPSIPPRKGPLADYINAKNQGIRTGNHMNLKLPLLLVLDPQAGSTQGLQICLQHFCLPVLVCSGVEAELPMSPSSSPAASQREYCALDIIDNAIIEEPGAPARSASPKISSMSAFPPKPTSTISSR